MGKFGEIDWMLLRELKAHAPLKGISPVTRMETRDKRNTIRISMDYVKNVLFSHKCIPIK